MSFFNTKQVSFQRVSPTAYLEIGVETTLSYYIVDPGCSIDLLSVEYKIDKLSGRDSTNVIAWTALDLTGVTDDIYNIDVTLNNVTTSDTLSLLIRTRDVDGVEAFYKDTEVTAI